MTSQFADMTSSSHFIWRCRVPLIKFSYWSKFHVNTITGSGVMTIFDCNGLTRNPEIGNITVRVFPNIWRLGQVSDTKFGMNVSNQKLLNTGKCQGYNLYHFWVIKENPTGKGGAGGEGVKIPPKLTQIKFGVVGTALMDLSKVYHYLLHGLLLVKLSAYGFDESAIGLIASYLSNR